MVSVRSPSHRLVVVVTNLSSAPWCNVAKKPLKDCQKSRNDKVIEKIESVNLWRLSLTFLEDSELVAFVE